MTPGERGFLLLTSFLGDPQRKPLTTAQFRELTQRVQQMHPSRENRDLIQDDLVALGYTTMEAQRIFQLFLQEGDLNSYLERAARFDCFPITRISDGYPHILRSKLNMDAPGCLWMKGNPEFLKLPAISAVGSRDLKEENEAFARELGLQAARNGYVLISGNARGADRVCQNACLEAGGRVISIVADRLDRCPLQRNVLYLSEEGFDLPFSSARALHRNRLIHAMGQTVFVVQSSFKTGGTWQGTADNLRHGYTPVICCNDASRAVTALSALGAKTADSAQIAQLLRI